MNQDLIIRTATGVLFFGSIAVSGYYRSRADRNGGKLPERPRGLPSIAFRVTFGLVMWGMVLLQLVAPKLVRWSFVEVPIPIRWVGVVLLLGAALTVWWTMRSIGTNISPSISAREGASLVTIGPYRWIRHPLYSAGFAAFLGVGVALGSIPCLVLLAPLAWWLLRRVHGEEESLITSYGDAYRRYLTRTGRFIPRFAR